MSRTLHECLVSTGDACSESCQTTKMVFFAKIVNGVNAFISFAEGSVADFFVKVLHTSLARTFRFWFLVQESFVSREFYTNRSIFQNFWNQRPFSHGPFI